MLDVWMLGSLVFVAAALFEFAAILAINHRAMAAKVRNTNSSAIARRSHVRTRRIFLAFSIWSFLPSSIRQVIDQRAIVVFPAAFLLFNVAYWSFLLA